MDGNYRSYDYLRSSERIREILNMPEGSFEEVEGNLPDRDRLTYTNGFYGTCSAVFIDIRDSSGLTAKHKRPRLAKIYRAFISEMVAVLNSDPKVREVNIVGDCVWAVYRTTMQKDLDDVFAVVFQANTLVRLLNYHLQTHGIDPIAVGIGVDDGRVLMIKAGFAGSGINDVVYMGDVVNRAAHLAHEAGRGWRVPIYVGSYFYGNLNEQNQSFLKPQYDRGMRTVYAGHVIDLHMDEWIDALA